MDHGCNPVDYGSHVAVAELDVLGK